MPDREVTGPFDAVVVIDGDRHRLTGPIHDIFHQTPQRFVIDHRDNRADGYLFAWISGETMRAPWSRRRWLAGENLDPKLAALLYAGTVYDTGGFAIETTSETHRLAADLLANDIDHVTIAAQMLVERRMWVRDSWRRPSRTPSPRQRQTDGG